MTNTNRFHMGQTVSWLSHAGGVARRKTGQIVQVVPALHLPLDQFEIHSCSSHKEESYVVRVTTPGKTKTLVRYYLPRVSQLQAVAESPEAKVRQTLEAAFALPQGNQNGMKISLSGVLENAQRALDSMSQPLEDVSDAVQEQFDARLMDVQPDVHAYALSELVRHVGLLKTALIEGDAQTVRQFIELYRLD